MSISFQKSESKYKIREPLFSINRTKFKSDRSSLSENVESNLLRIDLSRILNELQSIDDSILEKIICFNGELINYTLENKLNDGISSELEGLDLYIDKELATEQELVVDTTEKLSGNLSRLFYKISLLESGN